MAVTVVVAVAAVVAVVVSVVVAVVVALMVLWLWLCLCGASLIGVLRSAGCGAIQSGSFYFRAFRFEICGANPIGGV